MHRPSSTLLFAGLLAALSTTLSAQGDGWTSLFDGETLAGWTQRNGTATYEVQVMTGSSFTKAAAAKQATATNQRAHRIEVTQRGVGSSPPTVTTKVVQVRWARNASQVEQPAAQQNTSPRS